MNNYRMFIIILFLSMSAFVFYFFFNYQSKGVTRIIHQSWKNRSIPRDFQRYLPSWRKCFPHWEHRFWTDEDNRNLVKDHFPWYLEIYDSFPREIYRADVARYFYLYQYGGIYTDMDNECLAPFEHLLSNYTFVFGTIDGVDMITPLPENYVQNSFMYSRPLESFWLDLVRQIKWKSRYGRPDVITGPEHLCNMIHKYRTTYPNNHGMKIYDAWYFNPLSWGGFIKYLFCKPIGVMSDYEWKQCREQFYRNGSYVVQYHSHVWE